MFQPRIIVHLGASDVPEQFQEESVRWCRKAVETGYALAKTGAKAEDIVAATVSVLEDSPVSDAGIGAVFNANGGHQMDAGLMTGDKLYGAILSIHNVQNPIQVARLLVDDPRYSIICGEGAMEYVHKHNIPLLPDDAFITEYNTFIRNQAADPLDLFVTPSKSPPDHGTVGCVVRDIHGDSPFPGCGVWADDSDGGCSCTGYGEQILVETLASRAASRLTKMPAMEAAKEAINAFAKTPRSVGGLIMICKETGEYGLYHNTQHMPFAYLNDDGSISAHLSVHDL